MIFKQRPPYYMDTQPILAGFTEQDLYQRFQTPIEPRDEVFVQQALETFITEAKPQAVFSQFPRAASEVARNAHAARPHENVFLILFAGGEAQEKYPDGLILQSSAAASEKALAIGSQVFAQIEATTGLRMEHPLTNKAGSYVSTIKAGNVSYAIRGHARICGRHPFAAPADLWRVGKTMAQLEEGLAYLPSDLQKSLRRASMPHILSMRRAAKYVLKQHPRWLESCLGKGYSAQVIDTTQKAIQGFARWISIGEGAFNHMNMIPNNILLRDDGGAAILDATRIVDGYLPKAIDLGQAAFRTALCCPVSATASLSETPQTLDLVAIILGGYNNCAKKILTFPEMQHKMVCSLVWTKLLPQITLVETNPERAASGTQRFVKMVERVMALS